METREILALSNENVNYVSQNLAAFTKECQSSSDFSRDLLETFNLFPIRKESTRRCFVGLLFEKNLAVLSEKDPTLAERLAKVDASSLAFCETRQGEPNLCPEGGRPLHSSYAALAEAERWWKQLDVGDVNLLYIFGSGLGYSYDCLQDWLHADPQRYVVYLEEDERVLCQLLQTERASSMLSDPQVMFVLTERNEQARQAVAQELAYYYVGLQFLITALPSYELYDRDVFDRYRMHLMHAAAYVSFAGKEFMDYGKYFFRNYYLNSLRLPDASSADALYGRFAGVPAIICGAGPSLNQHLDLLRGLRERALLFAGGSAINALISNAVQPHFGASVDPNPIQAKRMQDHDGFELPVFYKGRVYFRALETLHGPHVYLAGANGYPVVNWMERELDIEGEPATEGHNCLHLLIDVARRMGCDPIIFVGMDLAYTGLQQYASGVVDSNQLTKEQITRRSNLNDNAFERKDINGQPVYTLWKWVAESDYTAAYAREHRAYRFLNATEGGLGFEGIDNVRLQDVAREFLKESRDLDGEVHARLSAAKHRHIGSLDVAKTVRELDESLKRSMDLCESMMDLFTKLKDLLKKGRASRGQKLSSELAQLRKQLSQEPACRELLEPVNHVRAVLFERRLGELERDSKRRSELERTLAHLDASCDEVRSLHEAAQLNRMLIEASFKEFDEQGYSLQRALGEAPERELELIAQEDGDVIELRSADGCLLSRSQRKGGQLHGEVERFYPSGSVAMRGSYTEGQLDGDFFTYWESGEEKTRASYVQGHLEGRVALSFSGGGLKRELHYTDGRRHGLERVWNRAGQLVLERQYDDGFVTHEKSWNNHGVLLEERWIREAPLPSDVIKWDENGTKRLEILYEEGYQKVREWDEAGLETRVESVPLPKSGSAGSVPAS